jgi:hypothetical protein
VCTENVCDPTAHTCSNPPAIGENGQPCTVAGTGGLCDDGACVPPGCGDGNVDEGEECDRGAGVNGVAGSGCTASCRFACDVQVGCSNGNPCDGDEACADVADGAGRICQSGTPRAAGAVCAASPRRVCSASGNCNR